VADKRGLRLIGYVYGGLTAAVTLIACVVVANHVSAQSAIDGSAAIVAQVQAAR
jgi:hypothetical protein